MNSLFGVSWNQYTYRHLVETTIATAVLQYTQTVASVIPVLLIELFQCAFVISWSLLSVYIDYHSSFVYKTFFGYIGIQNQVKWWIFHSSVHWGKDWKSFNLSLCPDCASFLLTSWNFSFCASEGNLYFPTSNEGWSPQNSETHSRFETQSSINLYPAKVLPPPMGQCNDVWYQCFHQRSNWAIAAVTNLSCTCFRNTKHAFVWMPFKFFTLVHHKIPNNKRGKSSAEHIEQFKFAAQVAVNEIVSI